MSSVFKGVKKVFKKVAKVARKVIPIALGVGALVFTVGGALGVTGMAGGWGGAINTLTSKLGATGVLQQTLNGALTNAGYGSVLGAAFGAASGGDIIDSAGYGTLAGGAIGGVSGGLGGPTDPLAGLMPAQTPVAGPGAPGFQPVPGPGGQPIGTPVTNTPLGTGGGPVTLAGSGGSPTVTGAATAAGATGRAGGVGMAGAGGGFSPPPAATAGTGLGQWVTDNQTIVGSAITGLGSGLVGMAQGDDDKAAAELVLKRDREQREATRENYGTGLAPYRSAAQVSQPAAPSGYNPEDYNFDLRYNPQTGTIDRVPRQATA